MAAPAAAAAAGGSSSSTGAVIASGAMQAGSSLIGDILGASIVRGVQAKRAERLAYEWNEKILDRQDQQNRFSNLMINRKMDQKRDELNEAKKMNNASLYQNQINQMLSTINNNANLKNIVLQRWGGL